MAAAESDILIAGAGPVGLTLASELRRHGVTPRVVDKASGPKDISLRGGRPTFVNGSGGLGVAAPQGAR